MLILDLLLLRFLPLALLARLRRLFVEELRQILKLRHDLHAAFLVASAGERTRPADHLLDVVLALLIQLGLRQLLLDPVKPLRAVLLLRQCRALTAKTSALLANSAVRKLRICIVRFPRKSAKGAVSRDPGGVSTLRSS